MKIWFFENVHSDISLVKIMKENLKNVILIIEIVIVISSIKKLTYQYLRVYTLKKKKNRIGYCNKSKYSFANTYKFCNG